MTRPMPGPPEKYQVLRRYVLVWRGGVEHYQHSSEIDAKRLTDAECAAERCEARADWMYMKFLIASRQIASMRARPNAPMPEPSPPLERKLNEARDRHYTWARFATRPHALEES